MRGRPTNPAALLGVLSMCLGACTEPGAIGVGVALGSAEAPAARMAFAEAADDLRVPVDTLILEAADTRAAPAIRSAEKLLAFPGIVAIIGHGNSAASLAAAPLYNSHAVVELSPHATAVLYSDAGAYSYRLVPPDDRQGRFIGQHLRKEAIEKRIALLYVNDDYGRGLRTELMNAVAPGALNFVLDAPHMEGRDSAEIALGLAALVAAKPDLIVWLGRTLELSRMLGGIRSNLGNVAILGSDALATAVREPNDGRWTGIRFVDFVDITASPEMRAFADRYRKRFEREPSGADVLTYDAVRVVLKAIDTGARSGADVRKFLDSLGRDRPTYQGLGGPVKFDEKGDVEREYVLRSIVAETR